ncbi:hypothetical protein MMC10_001670 [Thelotrema lepadinum]|nr:hypothetical protein [Thelotrema lepadinum]
MALRQPTIAHANYAPSRETRDRSYTDQELRTGALCEHTNHRRPQQQVLGPSILSDFGSLNSVPRSSPREEELRHNIEDAVDELDSLDEGLHAFREPLVQQLSRRSDHSVGAILPVHDGLGTFSPLRTPFNRRARSPNSVLPSLEREANLGTSLRPVASPRSAVGQQSGQPLGLEDTTLERIEKWRVEQSSYLLAEMESEEKRIEESQLGETIKSLQDRRKRSAQSSQSPPEADCDTLWQRLADQVLRRLVGIDDPTLFIIFGEYLPEEIPPNFVPSKASAEPSYRVEAQNPTANGQTRLLKRLKERLQRLSEQIVLDVSDMPELDPLELDYAGIPINWISSKRKKENLAISDETSKNCPKFPPTFRDQKPKPPSKVSSAAKSPESASDDQDSVVGSAVGKEYWTQISGLRSVLRYLCRRFLVQGAGLQEQTRSKIATSNSPETMRRAAVIQQHHPLVSAPKQSKTSLHRSSRVRLSPGGSHRVVASRALKRRSSSYVSLSTKRSCRPTSDGGSRNYWDIGESIATSSAVFAGVGAWGEL